MQTPSPPTDETPVFTGREAEFVRGAYDALAEVGARELSLRVLAKRLGVSPGLLVYYFKSKDGLFLEAMRYALLEVVERIRARLEDIDDPEEALVALVDALFDDPQSSRDFYLVYLDLVGHSVRDPSFGGLADLLWKYVNGSYAVVIQHGVVAGVFGIEDIELAARQCRALVEGSFLQWLQSEDWEREHARVRDDCLLALSALLKA